MLILVNGYIFLACSCFVIYALFPVIGPTINIGIMYWALLEMERLTLDLRVSNEKLF